MYSYKRWGENYSGFFIQRFPHVPTTGLCHYNDYRLKGKYFLFWHPMASLTKTLWRNNQNCTLSCLWKGILAATFSFNCIIETVHSLPNLNHTLFLSWKTALGFNLYFTCCHVSIVPKIGFALTLLKIFKATCYVMYYTIYKTSVLHLTERPSKLLEVLFIQN